MTRRGEGDKEHAGMRRKTPKEASGEIKRDMYKSTGTPECQTPLH